jgi:hypothetical protein
MGQLSAIQSAAPALGIELSLVDGPEAAEIERAIAAFARASNGGLTAPAVSADEHQKFSGLWMRFSIQYVRDLIAQR